jgi:excisionase family DNA binding protein
VESDFGACTSEGLGANGGPTVKRTRKWVYVGQEAQRLASLGMTHRELASKLGVQKSTITRWFASGKLTRARPRRQVGDALQAPKAPAEWAAAIRKDYALDPSDDQLVTLAQQALEFAYNDALSPATRSQARRDFQNLVKQLALGLSDRRVDAPEPVRKPTAPPPSPQRSGIDPRTILLH